jgi:hypothetical protein
VEAGHVSLFNLLFLRPPYEQFDNNSSADNLNIQHEALKTIMNCYESQPIYPQETTSIKKFQAIIEIANP